jgi:hypothetical protein
MVEEEKEITTTVKSNNDIFSMVFLSKPIQVATSPSNSTASTSVAPNSFSKQKKIN